MVRTSRRETFVVQPFWMSAKGLRAGEGKRLRKEATEADAVIAGERLAEAATGVIASYGDVPSD